MNSPLSYLKVICDNPSIFFHHFFLFKFSRFLCESKDKHKIFPFLLSKHQSNAFSLLHVDYLLDLASLSAKIKPFQSVMEFNEPTNFYACFLLEFHSALSMTYFPSNKKHSIISPHAHPLLQTFAIDLNQVDLSSLYFVRRISYLIEYSHFLNYHSPQTSLLVNIFEQSYYYLPSSEIKVVCFNFLNNFKNQFIPFIDFLAFSYSSLLNPPSFAST
jgi:hypothetical protein